MMKKTLFILFAALVIFNGCFNPFSGKKPDKEEKPFAPPAAVLDEDVWTDGYLGTADKDQWFKFTASANLHFVHIKLSNMSPGLEVQLYNKEGGTIGKWVEITNFSSSVKYVSYSSFTAGENYYVNVKRLNFSNSDACTYNIALNKSSTLPITIKLPDAINLTFDTPANGNTTSNDEEWFKFKATAETQYIHIIFNGMTDAAVQLYKVKNGNLGDLFGDSIRLSYNDKKYAKMTLTVGDEYYIKISPFYSYSKGAYQIAFNTLFIPPNNIIPLTAGTWTNDNFAVNSKEHWFIFTSNNASQYIHVDFGTDSSNSSFAFQGLDILLYDNSGNMVDSSKTLSSSSNPKYISRSVASGQDYYIRVETHTSSYSGTYKIGFTANTTPPTL